jgi:hypothetical protein
MSDLPVEVWRHIRSFDITPSASRTSSQFRDIDHDLLEERVYILRRKYEYMDDSIVNEEGMSKLGLDGQFMMRNWRYFNIRSPEVVGYYMGASLTGSIEEDIIMDFAREFADRHVSVDIADGATESDRLDLIHLLEENGYDIDYNDVALRALNSFNMDIFDDIMSRRNPPVNGRDIALSIMKSNDKDMNYIIKAVSLIDSDEDMRDVILDGYNDLRYTDMVILYKSIGRPLVRYIDLNDMLGLLMSPSVIPTSDVRDKSEYLVELIRSEYGKKKYDKVIYHFLSPWMSRSMIDDVMHMQWL